LSFSLDDADLLTGMDGSYLIKSLDDDTTEVTYQLGVSLSMPIPAMMRQKAEKTTIDQALTQLKASLEG
ncbi:MAG: polyketide cyclase / dehydrase and lipid transport, partial [Actinomycetes bacterium]